MDRKQEVILKKNIEENKSTDNHVKHHRCTVRNTYVTIVWCLGRGVSHRSKTFFSDPSKLKKKKEQMQHTQQKSI